MDATAPLSREYAACVQSTERLARRFGSTIAVENQADPTSSRYAELEGWSWTAPFYSGVLWLAFDATSEPLFKRTAAAIEPQLAALVQTPRANHDVGFFGQIGYRDPERRAAAANVLASRFVPKRNAIRSWDWMPSDNSIVDSLMTTNLLWGTAHEDFAAAHYARLADDIVRPDGSTFHVAKYNGSKLRKGATHQGLSDGSTWARGQAWAVHGYATAYSLSGDTTLRDTAVRVAEYALRHMPASGDSVPRWDYDADSDALPDSSAGAVLADGLLTLSNAVPDYREPAMRLLSDLSTSYSVAASTEHDGLLTHAHQGRSGPIFDASMPYGDYYYFRALSRVASARV